MDVLHREVDETPIGRHDAVTLEVAQSHQAPFPAKPGAPLLAEQAAEGKRQLDGLLPAQGIGSKPADQVVDCAHDGDGARSRITVKPCEPVRPRQQALKLPALYSAEFSLIRLTPDPSCRCQLIIAVDTCTERDDLRFSFIHGKVPARPRLTPTRAPAGAAAVGLRARA